MACSAAQLLMGHGGRGAGTEAAWSAKIREGRAGVLEAAGSGL